MKYLIRKMIKDDCKNVAHLITIAWNQTYKNIISDIFLKSLYSNEEIRVKNSYDHFDESENHQFVLEIDNEIVGYMNVGLTDDTEYSNCGEIHSIYILNGYKGYGYGKKMIDVGIEELKTMNCDKMLIGCLVGNPSNDFYRHLGGKVVKQRFVERFQLFENVYYFDKI